MTPGSKTRQIYEYLKDAIERGDFKPGELLPTDNELMEWFDTRGGGVIDVPVAHLRREGYIAPPSQGRRRRVAEGWGK